MTDEQERPAGPAAASDAASIEGSGLFSGLRRVGLQGMELLQVRLELFSIELEAEKLRLFSSVAQALMALLLGVAALGLLTLSLLLLCPDAWRWSVALGLALVHGALAWWCWACARRGLSQPGGAFAGSVAELARDREAMGA
ncbi:phage holin family protein [Roseateles koreensis]|uniref:Phage holin family protein n=1 Tax=Roseateles koreensis TaxID=2987526 RepID=A0ABT5KR33_9BURK|nr:phage holin family protein [Roseateles koreensis]MDC8785369.1 phage holin family protein [Roseateles koreensis]